MKVAVNSPKQALARRLAGSKIGQLLLVGSSALYVGAANADLPTTEAPSRGEGGGIIEMIQNYGYDAIMLIALILCAVGFLGVSYHSFTTFGEVQTGRKTWGQFGSVVAVGGVLLVLVIWLVTKASEIL